MPIPAVPEVPEQMALMALLGESAVPEVLVV
jgi:hypothetical protein